MFNYRRRDGASEPADPVHPYDDVIPYDLTEWSFVHFMKSLSSVATFFNDAKGEPTMTAYLESCVVTGQPPGSAHELVVFTYFMAKYGRYIQFLIRHPNSPLKSLESLDEIAKILHIPESRCESYGLLAWGIEAMKRGISKPWEEQLAQFTNPKKLRVVTPYPHPSSSGVYTELYNVCTLDSLWHLVISSIPSHPQPAQKTAGGSLPAATTAVSADTSDSMKIGDD